MLHGSDMNRSQELPLASDHFDPLYGAWASPAPLEPQTLEAHAVVFLLGVLAMVPASLVERWLRAKGAGRRSSLAAAGAIWLTAVVVSALRLW